MPAYKSERRQQQAQTTRRDILQAARRLFAGRGYAGTSMGDIAREAGVATQTIYASCGSKRDLVLALVDTIDEEADVASLAGRLAQSDDPEEIITLAVRITRQLNERCGDIIGALLSAASVEPDAAAAADEGKQRHREGTARTAHKLHALGALRDGLSADEAAALLATLTWQPIYAQLTHEHNWTYGECERWLTTMLIDSLLRGTHSTR
jgi:AcrR family transcriptional regulator